MDHILFKAPFLSSSASILESVQAAHWLQLTLPYLYVFLFIYKKIKLEIVLDILSYSVLGVGLLLHTGAKATFTPVCLRTQYRIQAKPQLSISISKLEGKGTKVHCKCMSYDTINALSKMFAFCNSSYIYMNVYFRTF